MDDIDIQSLMSQVQQLKLKGVSMVRFVTPDLLGRPRGKNVGIDCVEHMLVNGCGIYIGFPAFGGDCELPSFTELTDSGLCNVYLRPGRSTIQRIPWAKANVAEIICDVYMEDGSLMQQSPRSVLKRQLERLEKLDLRILSAFESEFTIYKKATMEPITERPFYTMVTALSLVEDLVCEISDKVGEYGTKVETCAHEYAPGQLEFTFKPMWGIDMIDHFMSFKQAVRSVCDGRDLVPTFMTRPFAGAACSNSSHFNHSLWDNDGKNIFYNAETRDLSDIGRWWVGGIMVHIDALTALCSSTINCYRRLHNPWAPHKKDWDINSRLCTWRVVRERGCRMENRLVSGHANPYIAMAATIAAGLDGVENKIEPPKRGVNKDAQDLPYTLQEALDALTNDKVMVDALGERFIEWWLYVKSMEIKHLGHHHIGTKDSASPDEVIEQEIAKEREFFFTL